MKINNCKALCHKFLGLTHVNLKPTYFGKGKANIH